MAARPVIALVCVSGGAGGELGDYLQRHGYEIREAREAWEAEQLLSVPGVDIAVIGEGVAPAAGTDMLRRFGREGGPFIIMMRRAGDLVEKVLALELGAADVVDPTASPREIAARVAGLLSRRGKGVRDLVFLEHSTVDLKSALVMHDDGGEEQLSAGQVALLRLFLANPQKVLSRDDIMAAAPAESAEAFDRSIDSRIVRLRRKLQSESITTVRGTGYRFDPPSRG